MSHNNEKKFQSRWGFILACVGSAVGMANVWGFPYKLGSNGGAAFLIPYLLFIILFSYVGLSTEYAVGRRAKTGTLGSYEKAWKSGNKDNAFGKNIGWLPLAGSMCIAIGYAVIISYVLNGLLHAITGNLMTVNPGKWFESFAFHDFSVVPLHLAIVVITLLTLIFGADSIEKTNKIMMPLFFLLFVFMAIRILLLPNAFEGYKFIFTPDWVKLANPMVWVWAMGQAFFSLSITGSGMIVYGAYLSDEEDVIGGARDTAFFDTIAAMVATFVMIPACFAYGLDPAGGPGLLFVTLPTILQDMPGGRLFAIALYLAVVFGGISSLQNMLEVVLESVRYRFPKLKRNYVLAILFLICMGIGLFMEPITKWGPWMDIVSIYIIPIGATIGAISWFWIMKKEDLLEEINKGRKEPVSVNWYWIGKFVYVPLALILCIIALVKGISF
ncbi:transporter [Fusobacterium necrophorum subsp. funduliforme]|uniref:Sodium-dependent transporter n=6 Tax=Fusobacterium TaxID=848 RepID=A0A4Q2L1M8_9FUSO|nr:sodium-dependent transporter [Fusobacterium necrophorum]AVQ21082.1 sodium-dependent transporter [Fusobacterium necrophorum subsp. funduliforme]AYV94863.1 sodium-dependent transporter [Fusobacterium necrophorum subsp. funduliforme]EFS23185.1 Sodium:neurotransmitter symporter family protein [Fusobacterium necrophorum D12]EJU15638.1 sodium:neurotransmitter symporter domain protein [Fusobacterium necrophorum subsp. funduliforme Fnf 1007]EYD69574.1 sodium- and chloride-dependent transporter, tyr